MMAQLVSLLNDKQYGQQMTRLFELLNHSCWNVGNNTQTTRRFFESYIFQSVEKVGAEDDKYKGKTYYILRGLNWDGRSGKDKEIINEKEITKFANQLEKNYLELKNGKYDLNESYKDLRCQTDN